MNMRWLLIYRPTVLKSLSGIGNSTTFNNFAFYQQSVSWRKSKSVLLICRFNSYRQRKLLLKTAIANNRSISHLLGPVRRRSCLICYLTAKSSVCSSRINCWSLANCPAYGDRLRICWCTRRLSLRLRQSFHLLTRLKRIIFEIRTSVSCSYNCWLT